MQAAGLLIVARNTGRVLMLLRAGSDHAGEWCFPGGAVDPSETPIQAAMRELTEECGDRIKISEPVPLMRRDCDGVDYTTFAASTETEVVPVLNDEHTAYAWTAVEALLNGGGMVLHPGALAALTRLAGDELAVAELMVAGQIVGPQDMGGFVMFLLRITGTGLSYRSADVDDAGRVLRTAEYVWRDASLYMTDRFLRRCMGLPVLWEHPSKKPKLDHEEFHKRIIGSVFVPYLKPEAEEVWAVVKIWDQPAARLMRDEQLSTSPGVMVRVRPQDKQTIAGGANLLVETMPQLIDHVAVVEQGVWDKGGDAQGIETVITEEPRQDAFNADVDALIAHNAIHQTAAAVNAISRRFTLP